jgi:HK97 family phage portal protein
MFSVFGLSPWRGRSSPATVDFPTISPRIPVGKNLPEKRSVGGDLGTPSHPSERLLTILGTPSSSGASVNESTALGVSAVLSCVSLLSDMVAKLPLELLRKTNRGPVIIEGNRAASLMAGIPSDMHTSFELRQLMMCGKGLGGNGYARVFRDAMGEPTSIQWIEPWRVTPQLAKRSNGERFVVYQMDDGELLTRYELIHIRGFSRDGINGLSPITLLRESIGTAMTQTAAAGKLMKNGAKFPGFLHTTTVLPKDKLDDVRQEWNSKISGAENIGSLPILNGLFDFKQTNGMSMTDAQFIESRRFELQEIARHYRIPPFLIGDSTASTTWGTGIQEQTLGFLNFCLDPHLRGFEEALNCTLLTTEQQAQGYYFRFDRDELASVSRQDTAAYFQTMRNIGVYSVNDIRAKLDEPLIAPEDGGDNYALPLNSSAKAPAEKPEPEPEPVED